MGSGEKSSWERESGKQDSEKKGSGQKEPGQKHSWHRPRWSPRRGKISRSRLVYKLTWTIGGKCLLVGLIAGILASIYRMLIAAGVDISRSMYSFASGSPIAIVGIIAGAVIAGLFVARLIKWEPMASGSGIPQTEGVLAHLLKMKDWTILVVRFVGGSLGALFGLSMGREGPCVQIGACGGKFTKRLFKKGGMEEECLLTAGSAAGLAAAFTAPLSGIVFTLEEAHRSFSPFLLISSAVSALVSAAVASFVFGLTPVLDFTDVVELPFQAYLWMLPLGIISGLMGALVNKGLLLFQNIYEKIPSSIRPMVAFLIAIPFGLFLPAVLGGGDNLISVSEVTQVSISMMFVLLIGKILFTCTSFGSGTPGGIFMPTLAIGAISGALFGMLMVPYGLPQDYVAIFAICGMAGTFSAAVKAPITGILLVVEMSGDLSHLLPLAIAAFVAMFIADLLDIDPIYSELLDRYIDKHGMTNNSDDPDRLFDVLVHRGSTLDGAEFADVDWPDSSIVIRVQKAERFVVPRRATRLRQGDHLIATPIGNRRAAKLELKELAKTIPDDAGGDDTGEHRGNPVR
ncbi:MAG: chloride channel protein [Coriobacteriales bacterium]